MAKSKKPMNVDMDGEIYDDFAELVEKAGYLKYRAVEAAFRAFMALPADVQVALMSNKPNPREIIVKTLCSVQGVWCLFQ